MEFFFGNSNEGSSHCNQDIARCPFLKNIHEPTNLSFSTSISTPMPVRNGKGPIFEDGPNFDTAFKLFHGQNGVVPLSERSFIQNEKCIDAQTPAQAQFNPLAAKAATISFSAFGPGGPFGFDAFSKKWKKDKKQSNSSKKESSSSKPKGGKSEHEAMGNEWLQNGNCPIAKSYQAVSKVLPLVAKTIQLPPGMKYKCPQVIIAARSALAKTAFAKNLRPQPLSSKVLVIGVLGMAANIPLGVWREHTEKFSVSWFAAVHAAVPFIAMLRKSVLMPKSAMALTIAASILGQVIGSRAERYRLKAIGLRTMESDHMSSDVPASLSRTTNGCGTENNEWKSNTLQVTVASVSTDVFY